MAPVVEVESLNPGASIARDLCLTIALGAAAASECGDLRVVHPLPTTRTMNRAHTPVLLYNSQHAQPFPLVAAHVKLPDISNLRRVVATLRVNGSPRAQRSYPASAWPDTFPRRVVLGYDASGEATNVYLYALEVAAYSGAAGSAETGDTTVVTGELVVVNRRQSSFGAGWWLAGFERLYLDPQGLPGLWVGGDGSTRRYRAAAGVDTAWVAPSLDRPDTIVWSAQDRVFRRLLPDGGSVEFDDRGRHVATANRLGHRTEFHHDRAGRLESVELPVPRSAATQSQLQRSYRFTYGPGGALEGVVAPPLPGKARVTRLFRDGIRVGSIQGPDTSRVRFGFVGSSARVESRTDRRQTLTLFDYDAASRVSGSTVRMEGTGDDIVIAVRPAESAGFSTPVDTAAAFVWLDGPRGMENNEDVGDTTRIWIDRWGAPQRVVDALGHETLLERENTNYPGLVTQVTFPVLADGSRRILRAVFDARGRLERTVDVEPLGSGSSDRVTRYAWDSKWDRPTGIIPTSGDSVTVAYDSINGNPDWQQDARGDSTRVSFGYNEDGLLRSVAIAGTGTSQRYGYDALGNLAADTSRLGFVTRWQRDAIGRDTLVQSPIDGVSFVTARISYDLTDRDTLTHTDGPAMPYVISLRPATPPVVPEGFDVHKTFDAEGNLINVTSAPVPNPTGREVVVTYAYDRANRQTRERRLIETQGLIWESRNQAYDAAGNTTRTWDERNRPIVSHFDALNRLVRRIVPSVSYPHVGCDGPHLHPSHGLYCEGLNGFDFPLYDKNASGGYTASGDTATFAYDAMGNLTRAYNRWARVDRTYFRNGTLESDSLWTRGYVDPDSAVIPIRCPDELPNCPQPQPDTSSADGIYPDRYFRTHAYGLQYVYDTGGRRSRLILPGVLAPAGQDTVRYAYAPHGALGDVWTPDGYRFSFHYDREGRFRRLQYPDTGSVLYTYDDDGQLTRRLERRLISLHADTMQYDGRGKLLWQRTTVSGGFDEATYHYSGLGRLIGAVYSAPGSGTNIEEWRSDALGHMYWSWSGNSSSSRVPSYSYVYDPSGSRLERKLTDSTSVEQPAFTDLSYSYYDFAGNVRASGRVYRDRQSNSADRWTAVQSYYDADNRLVALQRDERDLAGGQLNGTFDTYRYDALGRRVLVRSRREQLCRFQGEGCASSVTRTIWDGDQVLAEIRAPGSDTTSAGVMEDDSPSGEQYGIVSYTHGGRIDAPLAIHRRGHPAGAATVVPHANHRGVYDVGTHPDGARLECGSSGGSCIDIRWPAPFRRLYRDGNVPPGDWVGSLILDQQDASGLMYRRNRYYDPQTGRFTQPDPIGIAGGLNLYGYADGDPVTFSDPFGLCPMCYPLFEAGATLYDLGDLAVTGVNYLRGRASGRDLSVTAAGVGAGIVGFGGGYGRAGRLALSAADSWGNAATLGRHFRDHGADFGANNADEYASMASDFLQTAQRGRLPTKIDSEGITRVFDPRTNTFGSYNPDGTTRTFFKPTSSTYWDRQPGSSPWTP